MDNKQILITKLKGEIATLEAQNKRLESDLEHERKAHALELENLQLKAASLVAELERALESRTPILSALLGAATQMAEGLETSLALLPPPESEGGK